MNDLGRQHNLPIETFSNRSWRCQMSHRCLPNFHHLHHRCRLRLWCGLRFLSLVHWPLRRFQRFLHVSINEIFVRDVCTQGDVELTRILCTHDTHTQPTLALAPAPAANATTHCTHPALSECHYPFLRECSFNPRRACACYACCSQILSPWHLMT